jgi:ATP-dependent helicase/nuclease subunit B
MSEQGVKRFFWGWERPVLEAAVERLTAAREVGQVLDLSDTLVLVPTAEAGRRLRRALAVWADQVGRAVSVPHVWHPQMALRRAGDEQVAASELEVRMAWVRVLQGAPLEQLSALFPLLPETVSWSWCLELGGVLTELQQLLGAGGLTLAEVAERAGEVNGAEMLRWRDLARLEGWFDEALEAIGKREPQRLKRERAMKPELPAEVKQVVVLAAPDLPPLLDHWLRGCVQVGRVVEVAVQAAVGDAADFDAMGRPLVAAWGEDAGVDLGLRTTQLRVCRESVAQAEEVVRWLDEAVADGLTVAVGVGDAEVAALLRERLAGQQVEAYEPGGMKAQQEGFWHLLERLGELGATGNWGAFVGLLRIEEVRRLFAGSGGLKVLREADQFGVDCLPGSLDLAADLVGGRVAGDALLPKAMAAAQAWRRRFAKGDLVETAREWLLALYGERPFKPDAEGDRERIQMAWAWLEALETTTAAVGAFGLEPSREAVWQFALSRVAEQRLDESRGDVDLVLQGWLELLWESAPALVVAGMNEENVPGILLSHPFLPDRFRQQLGLPCQATRFARDAYLLKAMVAQREKGGRLGLVCGQWSGRGESRRPSRLLMLCEQAVLAERVRHLFPGEEEDTAEADPAKTLAWVLRPELQEPKLETISASRLGAYLDCPFRFYLSKVLKMSEVGTPGREMDAMQFGKLVHAVMKRFAEDAEARRWTHAGQIKTWLGEALRVEAGALFGKRPPPLVRLQVEMAEQRLRALAEVEANERQAGWEIVAAELDLLKHAEVPPLLIDGVPLAGVVDRVERNAVTGAFRVMDFKTGDKVGDPVAAHCAVVKEVPEGEAWRFFEQPGADKRLCWKDLQLPLYAAALRAGAFGPVTAVGYYAMPKAVTETQAFLWAGYDEHWESLALNCAAEAVRRIRAERFWPPNEGKVKNQDFEALLLGGALRSAVAPSPRADL